jgi:hypothetical protein
MNNDARFVSMQQAATALGMSIYKIRQLVAAGELKAIDVRTGPRIYSKLQIEAKSLDAFVVRRELPSRKCGTKVGVVK